MTPDGPTTPLLRVRDLAVSFGPVRAVDGVSLTIHPRQTLAVVGESGCGKSVTAMSLLQLIPRPPGILERGQAWFQSDASPRDLLAMSDRDIRRIRGGDIAMIFQEPMTCLNPVFTIGDQIVEAVRLHQGLRANEAAGVAAAALREVEIDDPPRRMNQYPHEFSGGMRQRVMIAMALACRPRLLLADEPTTALDVTIQAQILALLRRLQRERAMAMMLITHSLGIVAQHADVACVMYAGRVVECATVPALFASPLHPYTRGLLASIPSVATRRDRLATIRQVIDDPGQFQRLPGLRPWWPRHQRPADVPASGADSALLEAEPGHWLGVWRTEAVAQRSTTDPDLAYLDPN